MFDEEKYLHLINIELAWEIYWLQKLLYGCNSYNEHFMKKNVYLLSC